ncbi:hypothetical protein [Streptomyces sp. AC550_RSS872]|uniref:hypothetical protein n=1 Tax=Streptomyces sp. AC550_RSS872 TaxID=2823689 RepID=UPI001C277E33|nr:hypothetical protein [Streptomyces sp. AC550_RSS872]
MGGGGTGEVRWNKDTQSWERVGAGGHPAPPPPPAKPVRPPTAAGLPAGFGEGTPGEGPAGEPADGATPPDWPQPPSLPPEAPRGRRGRVVAAAVGAAVAVTALASWLAVDMAGDDGDTADRAPASTAGVSRDDRSTPPPDTPSDAAPTSEDPFTAASESPEVPAGYRPVEDPSGFSTVVPEDWTRSEQKDGAVVFYTSPDERALMQIFEVVEAGYTPDDALDVAVGSLSGQPGFKEISRGTVPEETYASELVYEYDSEDLGERVRAVDRVFQTDDGRLYAMVVRGTTEDWPATRETLESARAAFTPS